MLDAFLDVMLLWFNTRGTQARKVAIKHNGNVSICTQNYGIYLLALITFLLLFVFRHTSVKKKSAIISKCVIMSTFYRSPADRLNNSLVWELLFQQPKSLQIVVEVAEDIFLRAFLPLRSSTSSGAYVRPTVLLGIIAIQYTSYSPGYCQVHDTGVWLQGLPD